MVTFAQLGKYGRLGNQMFQIAGTIGVAVKNGYIYAFPRWVNYDHKERFGSSEDVDIQKHFLNPLPFSDNTYPDHFVHWGFQGFNHPDHRSYSGHFQSPKYFDHCRDTIKYYFTPSKRVDHLNYSAIHIRLGDYGGDYHPIQPLSYYEKAMKKIPGPYLIFSDEPKKAKEIFGSGFSYDESDYLTAFFTMMACKNFIIGNSTYSWWPAWLSDGHVVAPKMWFGPAANLSSDDLYPENWILI